MLSLEEKVAGNGAGTQYSRKNAETLLPRMFFKPQHLHFIGIGGIGMSGIAEVLLTLGYQVSGSDLRLSPATDRLEAAGATVFEGHEARYVEGAKAVVVSSAVDSQNPELVEARRLGIPIIRRGEMLAELMRLKYGIAIAGSHGKTTVTSLTATILSHGNLDPTVVVGGRVKTLGGSNARVGASDFLLVESDESDGSFLQLAPIIAVVTNIDREHLDHYPTLDDIREAFLQFVNKTPFYGAVILCLDDENIQSILPNVKRRTITYGFNPQADLVISDASPDNFGSVFELARRGAPLGQFRVAAPGRHNVLNATAALAVALELEMPLETIREGLAQFSGVDRRMQIRGEEKGIVAMDDYGHHPTEIKATLEAAREGGYQRILVLFQPHRYSRTQHLLEEFAKAFHQADQVYVTDIYAASEKPIEGVTAKALVERMREFGHRSVTHVGSLEGGVAELAKNAEPGDLVLTLGAGSVWKAADDLLARLRERSGA